ncbi:Zinc metalloproteinase aureolysin [Rhynchospora pubera]|uniref:Zinc metalloproteinase aureolysin n=1 Tax=Rhynchospora pubera TaxID=906938 RepID=A0AAV8EYB6_9POAL|nr:Zinc metalloproteinase aureolysin [Rhynchospora pubera]
MASLLKQLPRVVRQLEHDVETVINILQPGPLGIIEHKFTAQEVKEAQSIVKKAVENWKRNKNF